MKLREGTLAYDFGCNHKADCKYAAWLAASEPPGTAEGEEGT